jgi:phosphatidyl-myo-inositol dimannoside synthase
MMAKGCKMLMILPSFAGQGGIQRFNRSLLAASDDYCSKVKILSLCDSNSTLSSLNESSKVEFQGAAGSRIRFVFAAALQILFGNWDVIVVGHINLVRMVDYLMTLRLGRRHARVVLIAHGIEIWDRIDRLHRLAIEKCWRVAAVSAYTRDSVLNQVPKLSSQRCVLFPNVLGKSWVDMQAGMQKTKASLTLPDKFILSVSRLTSTEHYKGIVSVIESISSLTDPDIHYVIAGGGDDVGFLQRAAVRCDVADRVHILSGLDDAALAALYRKALAFVLPSGKEGFGIVYLEAMYFELPVIAARARGAVDVVVNEQTGLLVEYGDVTGIAHAIDRVSGDGELRAKLIKAGKQLVTQGGPFTPGAMAKRWQDILAEA